MAAACAFQAEAAPKAICGLSGKTDAVLSPDGRLAAVIRYVPVPEMDIPGGKEGNLWLRDCRSGRERRLMPAPGKPNREGNMGGPVFSLDGRLIYVDVAYGGSSTLTYRVDPATGSYDNVFPAGVLA